MQHNNHKKYHKLKNHNLESYNYRLPTENIAQIPTLPHHNAKLLICKKNTYNTKNISSNSNKQENTTSYDFSDDIFFNITKYINEDSVLFFNNTKVFKARIPLKNISVIRHSGYKTTITAGEILIYQIISEKSFEALVSDDKNFKPGSKIFLGKETLTITKLSKNGVIFETENPIFEIVEHYGQLPLPPYIKYEKHKEQRYQTVFAKHEGSAAAPTASLHFTDTLLQKLSQHNIHKHFLTLHVGLGTFKPIFEQDITQYHIHDESAIIPISIFKTIAQYKLQHKKIIPVGTTMIRTLESLPYLYHQIISTHQNTKHGILNFTDAEKKIWDTRCKDITDTQSSSFIPSYQINTDNTDYNINNKEKNEKNITFQTQLYIYPGFTFKIIDAIITNFHLPKTSLMILIAAWMGKDNLDTAYQYAIDNNYQFYSFGDGMLIF